MPSVEQLPIFCDGHVVPLSEHFEVIDGPRDCLVLAGDLSKADRIGGGMQQGMMTVESDVGLNLAEGMKQGSLIVHGHADDFACSQLRGGLVRIAGNVGDYCGGASKGLRRGMRGGKCVVAGNAGRFLGYRMRRGTLQVCGEVAEGCASFMIAGSILVGGYAASPIGVGMRRGTVLLFSGQSQSLPVGFTPPEPVKLSFLPLLLGEAEPELMSNCRDNLNDGTWHRSLGDRASGGTGEILTFRPKLEEVLQ